MDNFTFPKDENNKVQVVKTEKVKKSESKGFLKYVFVGIIVLILVILSLIIKGKVYDREAVYNVAKEKIENAAGGVFYTHGIFVSIPWESEDGIWEKNNYMHQGAITVQAANISYDANITSEIRELGIYSSPVFSGSLSADAFIDLTNVSVDKKMKTDYSKAWVCISVKDTSLIECPKITINGAEYKTQYNAAKNCLYCEIDLRKIDSLEISTTLNIRGSNHFRIFLNSTNTELNIISDWPSPGFSDYDYLPVKKELSDNGFTARWSIPFDSADGEHVIGFSYIQPVDLYTKLNRTVEYAFLFIIVPFIVLFMFEVFAKVYLHPMNYLLSGAASVLYFLLLLSISEHLSFGLSYLLGAFAAGLLVSLYVCWITGKKKLGFIMSFVFILLYTYLYVCLMSEDYALLMGSIFAFILLAVIMFITRNINWSNLKKNSDTDLI